MCCTQKDLLAALLAPRPSRYVPLIPLKLPVADHIFIDREVSADVDRVRVCTFKAQAKRGTDDQRCVTAGFDPAIHVLGNHSLPFCSGVEDALRGGGPMVLKRAFCSSLSEA